MRPTLAALIALALAAPAWSASAVAGDRVADGAAKVNDKVVAWRRDLHAHPELGNHEDRTAKLVATELKKLGLDVRTGIARTGVVAILKGGKPGAKIAIRADMDALPVKEEVDVPFASKVTADYRGEKVGVMHACGHDSHTAMLLGIATAMTAMRRDIPGEVMFVFQPAEEGPPPGEPGGAPQMLKEGVFRDFKPDAMFGMHVMSSLRVGEIGWRSGPAFAASDRFGIVVHGRQTHGAQPWLGVDPVVAASEIVLASQAIVSRELNIAAFPAVLTFGAIKGGVRYNIVPDSVELIGTIRTFDGAMRDRLMAALKRTATSVAEAHAATVDLEVPADAGNPVMVNDPALTARAVPSLAKVVPADHVVEMPLQMVAEDYANFAKEVPSFYFFVGATPADRDPATAPSNHSPKFFLDEGAMPIGVRAMLQVTLDYLAAAAKS